MRASFRLSFCSTPSDKLHSYPITFFLLFLLLGLSHHPNLALELTGPCKQQCDENRPPGVKQPFIFKCDQAYPTGDPEKDKCLESCVSCPQEVCDEAVDASYWHCPSTKVENAICLDFCDKQRDGRREKFILNCDELYSKDEDRKACKQKCSGCPSFVCQSEQPHIFHCPDEEVEHLCRNQCDMVREYGQLGPFTFNCEKKWGNNHFAKTTCQSACRKYCPFWVCDAGINHNEYQCPSIQLDKDCQKFCDANRPPTVFSEPYQLNCKKLYRSFPPWQWACEEKCNMCDTFPRVNPICNENNLQFFNCPQEEPEHPPEPQLKTSSLEACIARCENNRAGGLDGYTLNCLMAYATTEEKFECLADCRGCPIGMCSGMEIHCPAAHEAHVEEEFHNNHEGRMGNGMMQNDTLPEEKQLKEEKKITTWIILGFTLAFFLVLWIFLGILCWRAKRARDEARIPLQQQHFIQASPKYPRQSNDSGQPGFGVAQTPQYQQADEPQATMHHPMEPHHHQPVIS